MVQKTVTRKATSFQKAGREAVANSKAVQRHINRVWNLGPGAPMFRKEVAKIDPETGKGIVKNGMPVVVRRSVRLIQGHAYNIACAGAVRAAVREIKDDCEKWGIPYTINTNHLNSSNDTTTTHRCTHRTTHHYHHVHRCHH